MNRDEREAARKSPSPATVVAGVLIVLGIALPMYLAIGFLILVGPGVFVAGHLDDPVALLLEGAGVVAPFFVLAWTAGHWPRTTGVALAVLSLVVPVAGCGLALVRQGEARQAEDTSGA